MKHEKEKRPIIEVIKDVSVVVSLFLVLTGVVVSLLNLYTLSKLSPLNARLDTAEAKENQIASDLVKHEKDSSEFTQTLATKEQIDSLKSMMDGRLTRIENRVEFLYQKGLK